jgi:HK97 family phage prohead protease
MSGAGGFPEGAGLEHKYHRPEAGLMLAADASIAGYASLFGAPDQGGDVVVAGAYAASLAALVASGRRVKMLWQHDPAQPIGVWDEVREDARGLWVRGRILADVARGREALALIGAGALDGLSIGYRTKRAERVAGGGRRLIEVELWEVSLVTFPMLPQARVSAKAVDDAREGDEAALLRALAATFTEATARIAQG